VRCVDYDKVKENTTPYESVDDKTKQAIYTQFYGKKIAYNGDSICEGSGSFVGAYAKMVAELTGGTYFNNAVGGGHLAVYSDRHIICETVSEMPDDADLICFEGGINDYWGNCVIGSLTSGYTDAIDTTTLMGALESIFRQAIAKWVGKPICFIIVHKVRGTDTTPNSNGDTFTDFHDAIVEACNKYSIPYLDMFLYSGMNCNIQTIAENYTMASSSGQWGVDGCHPTEDGYKVYYISKILEFFKKQLSMY
jgi:lysophospholipase L1-like esterase